MADKRFAMDLAKLAICAAWADGEIQPEEVNTLKQLMLRLPDVTTDDWLDLQLYLDHPVTEEESAVLLENVLAGIGSKNDRELVMSTLTALVEADGIVTPEEAELVEAVREAIEARTTVVGTMTGLFARAVRALTGGSGKSVREDRIADYLHNPVYFRLSHRVDSFDVAEEVLRRACLAAGMMAKVACADNIVAPVEETAITEVLATDWGLEREDAATLCKVGLQRGLEGLDAFRLGEALRSTAPNEQRSRLLTTLFRIAASDGLGEPEIAELRKITKCLGLTHRDFIDSKTAGS
jgi:uncharacterized tellurite resistance protein B-like protein